MKKNSLIKLGVIGFITASSVLAATNQRIVEAASNTTPITHIGTYDGSTTFTTSSANGVNPGLFIEVMDKDGNVSQYESEDGVITVENTRAGAYVTQAKLLGKTVYRDLDTGELLDNWEEGRNLELESSQMPVLTTTGKNLALINDIENIQKGIGDIISRKVFDVSLKPNTKYSIKTDAVSPGMDKNRVRVYSYDESGTYTLRADYFTRSGVVSTFTTPNELLDYFVTAHTFDDNFTTITSLQIEEGGAVSSYEPFKSNILRTNEDVTLRGIGDVQDELDLITGEVTERIGEIVLDGSEDESWSRNIILSTDSYSTSFFTLNVDGVRRKFGEVLTKKCDKFPVQRDHSHPNDVEGIHQVVDNEISIRVLKTNLLEDSVVGFKSWLSNNPLSVQFQLTTESIKTVGLTADGYFAPETSAQVSIKGETVPLVASITVPTETLSFVIDPNQEVDQQFIAPEFTVTNDTYAPLKLEIKTFTQLTNGMNDVLPSKHSDWTTLGKAESNDIALAVVPKAGAGWKSLIEGERYVADDSNYELGVINPAETVEFGFSALHGPTITKPMNLQYTLGLIFDFE